MLEKLGPDIFDALRELVVVLLNRFGIWGTLAIFSVFTLGSMAWRVYSDRRKDRYIRELIQEKERTIQSLTEELRYYRALIFKEKFSWTDEQVNKYIVQNEAPIGTAK